MGGGRGVAEGKSPTVCSPSIMLLLNPIVQYLRNHNKRLATCDVTARQGTIGYLCDNQWKYDNAITARQTETGKPLN